MCHVVFFLALVLESQSALSKEVMLVMLLESESAVSKGKFVGDAVGIRDGALDGDVVDMLELQSALEKERLLESRTALWKEVLLA